MESVQTIAYANAYKVPPSRNVSPMGTRGRLAGRRAPGARAAGPSTGERVGACAVSRGMRMAGTGQVAGEGGDQRGMGNRLHKT